MKLDNRIWALITVVVCGAVLAGAWFIGASPFLAAAGAAQQSLGQVDQQNAQTTAQNLQLKKSQSRKDELDTELASLRRAVPEGVAGTAFISEVNAIAASSGATVTSITLGSPAAYTSPVVDTAPVSAAGAASPSPTTSASATPTPTPTPTGPVAPVPTTSSLISSSNFVLVPVTVVVTGSADQASAFLHGVQHGDRLFLVTQLSRSVQDSGGVELTAQGSVYVIKSTTTPAAANG